ncbi:hypothetical protein CWI36_1391p0010 [Hamiltosporidium magnivora]|uniref:Endonuclease/exonuclease/phosphatase domain-containing protein n=1 Tax=Hamiltosporidium magnivora TaxID=148818 RepID=A0A4Q9L2L4_9MICR|nr:hypothetical protein CWI36_1391p0010 [Hamiltosporidium magnivora]
MCLSYVISERKIDIVALQEMRWTRKGIMNRKDYSFYYSCHEKYHLLRTGFMVGNKIKPLIQYEERGAFYDILRESIRRFSVKENQISARDMNAKIGKTMPAAVLEIIIISSSLHDLEQESHTPEIKKELGLSDITPVCFKEEKRKKIFYREDIDDKWNRLKQNIVAAAWVFIRFKRNVKEMNAFILQTNSCRSKTGEIISDTQENTGECGDQAATDNIFDALENTGIYEDIEPFYGKVHKAVEKQKNKKASRTEEIPSELIKNRGGNYIKELTDLILVI